MGRNIHDDLTLEPNPSNNVDYLAYHWGYEEARATKRYLTRHKIELQNFPRLENALWRAWFSSRQNARRLPASCIGWDKDADNNWLYGPLKPDKQYHLLGRHVRRTKHRSPGFLRQRPRVRFNEEVQQCQYLAWEKSTTILPITSVPLKFQRRESYPLTLYEADHDICFDPDQFYEVSFDFDGTLIW